MVVDYIYFGLLGDSGDFFFVYLFSFIGCRIVYNVDGNSWKMVDRYESRMR